MEVALSCPTGPTGQCGQPWLAAAALSSWCSYCGLNQADVEEALEAGWRVLSGPVVRQDSRSAPRARACGRAVGPGGGGPGGWALGPSARLCLCLSKCRTLWAQEGRGSLGQWDWPGTAGTPCHRQTEPQAAVSGAELPVTLPGSGMGTGVQDLPGVMRGPRESR